MLAFFCKSSKSFKYQIFDLFLGFVLLLGMYIYTLSNLTLKTMGMKYLIGVFLMIILSSICNAEIIDGPANIRTQPEGEILFSIEDGAYTNVVRLENDWYMINICAWVEIVNIENNKLIIGSFLTTITNRKVCSIINPTEIDRILNVSENKARVQISGYTFKSNLRENEIC
ncbi:MAG: hypothetical protein DRJ05_10695, partial [Bacteroidetes bacterium]